MSPPRLSAPAQTLHRVALGLVKLSRYRLAGAVLIAAGIVSAALLTRAAGGTSSGLPHLFYLPIFLAAFIYGWLGGLVSALTSAVVCASTIPVDAQGTPQDTRTWLVRTIFFVAAGLTVGGFSSAVRAHLRQIRRLNEQVIRAFVRAIDLRHHYTAEHSTSVSDQAAAIARQLGLEAQAVERVRWAALLHDVGKLAVPRAILDKPRRLSASEQQQVRSHVEASLAILCGVDAFAPYLPGVRHHHERLDGSGYPQGLHGDAIPLDARIIAVADAFDAMTSPRPYRPVLSAAQALAELRRASGSQFDPAVVEALARALAALPAPRHRAAARAALPRPHPPEALAGAWQRPIE